jgi:hypothetical protein
VDLIFGFEDFSRVNRCPRYVKAQNVEGVGGILDRAFGPLDLWLPYEGFHPSLVWDAPLALGFREIFAIAGVLSFIQWVNRR